MVITKADSREPRRSMRDHYFSKSFEKGIKILGLFTPDRTSLNLKEISRELGLNMTSAFRYVNTLVRLNYIRREPGTKLLKLGNEALAMGYRLTKSFSPLQTIKPFLDGVHERHNISVDSSLFEKLSVVRLYQREVKGALTFRLPIVESALHCTAMGKAILAFLPEKEMLELVEVLALVAKTKHSITERGLLLAELKRTRKRGYSLNVEEYMLGVISIGAPLLNRETKRPLGAICFDFLTVENSASTVEKKYSPLIVKLARDISEVIALD
jgi:IclR family KDG regulon transcriptional repressor